MILVVVGTQKFKFNRLFDYINSIKNENIIVQCGDSNYKFNKNIKKYNYIPYEKLQNYLKKCDILICHTTPSCVFDALKLNKKVITVPRIKKYKEHFNNHQVHFANYLKEKNYCSVVYNKQEFINAINNINNYKFNKYQKKDDSYIEIIKKDIDKLLQ